MTAPAGDGARPAAAAAAPKLRRSQVVEFTAEDPILGGSYTDVGVVLSVDDEQVTIRPLAHHAVLVNPANVRPVSTDDVAG